MSIFSTLAKGIPEELLIPYIQKELHNQENFKIFLEKWTEYNDLPF
ncbi:MAG: hypothetical protein IPJ74_14240 [Saprospiraceae bacterium]|nr:hypothetical protein [Saprospiraceae bacterium]